MRRLEKIGITIVSISMAIGIGITHVTGSLYPGLPIGAGISTVVLAGVVLSSRSVSLATLGTIIGIGSVYRLYAFDFPASLVSFDPDAYAVQALMIAQRGSNQAISSDFYGVASGFSVFIANVILIPGLPADSAMGSVALLAGLVIPLAAMAITRRLTKSDQAVALAGLLTTIAPATIKFGIRANPIFFSGMIFSVFAVVLIAYSERDRSRYMVLFSLLLLGLAVTHKIAVMITVLVCAILLIGSFRPIGNAFGGNSRRTIYTLTIVAGLTLAVQWVFLTQYVTKAAVRIAAVLGVETETTLPRTAAVAYDPGLTASLIAFSFVLVTLSVGGLVWLYLLLYRDDPSVSRLLAIVAGGVAMALPGQFSTGAGGTQRTVFFATAGLGAMIATGYRIAAEKRGRIARSLFVVAIVFVLLSQPVSNASTPDYRDAPRQYLTEGEVVAKSFAQARSPDAVHLDEYYWDEVIDFPEAAADGGDQYQATAPRMGAYEGPIGRELTNGTLLDQEYNTVLLRTTVGAYRMDGGRWVLTWDPVQTMQTSPNYHQTYSNGDAVMFSRVQSD